MKIINKLEESIQELAKNKSIFYKQMNEQQPQIQFRLKIATLFKEYLDKYDLSTKELYNKLIDYYGKENINFCIRTFQKMISDQNWQGGTNRDEGLKNGKLKILLICRDILGTPIRDFLEIREVSGISVKKPSIRTFYSIIGSSDIGNDFSIFKLWPIMQALNLDLNHLDALFEIVHNPQDGFNDNDKDWLLAPHIYDDDFGKFINSIITKLNEPFSLSVEIHLSLPHEMPLIEKLVLHKSNAKSPFQDQDNKNLGWYAKEINRKITTKLLTQLNIKCLSTMHANSTRVKIMELNDETKTS